MGRPTGGCCWVTMSGAPCWRDQLITSPIEDYARGVVRGLAELLHRRTQEEQPMILVIGCGYIGERVADLLHARGMR